MGSWGRNDTSSNSVNFAARLISKGSGSANVTANSTAMYGNNTVSAFVPNQIVGVFAVTAAEMNNANGAGVVDGLVSFKGSGYVANAVATIVQGNTATANASANATGRATINLVNAGNLYSTSRGFLVPTLSVAAPTAQTFNSNTMVSANGKIAIGSNVYQNNDLVTYKVAAGNTAIVGLTANTAYFVLGANSSSLYLGTSANGTFITLTPSLTSESGHSLTGQTAAGGFVIANAFLGTLALSTQTNFGSGYLANAVVTVNNSLSGGYLGVGATANAHANATTGYIDALNITANGTGYLANPPVTIAAPAAKTFNANTGVVNNTVAVVFNNGDYVQYLVAAGNTALVGLTANAFYFVAQANATTSGLALTNGGAKLTITPSATSETGHSLTGQTATGTVLVGGTPEDVAGVSHPGWHLRKLGTGGRAGRISVECLVAMANMAAGTNNAIFPTS